jgi:hypothetical protein
MASTASESEGLLAVMTPMFVSPFEKKKAYTPFLAITSAAKQARAPLYANLTNSSSVLTRARVALAGCFPM